MDKAIQLNNWRLDSEMVGALASLVNNDQIGFNILGSVGIILDENSSTC